MNLLRQSVKALLAAGLPPERWLVRGPRERLIDVPTLSLTFDDGPHPEHTPRVLDELRRWDLTATFFVIGREAERYPELITRIVEEGHALGNHTFTHSVPRSTSAERFLAEVEQTHDLLSVWAGEPCRWVRPPLGELTLRKLRGLWQANHTVVLWNVDPRDYRMNSSIEARTWTDSHRPRHGDIVLLHDNRPAAVDILSALGRRGLFDQWRSVAVGDWLKNLPKCSTRTNIACV